MCIHVCILYMYAHTQRGTKRERERERERAHPWIFIIWKMSLVFLLGNDVLEQIEPPPTSTRGLVAFLLFFLIWTQKGYHTTIKHYTLYIYMYVYVCIFEHGKFVCCTIGYTSMYVCPWGTHVLFFNVNKIEITHLFLYYSLLSLFFPPPPRVPCDCHLTRPSWVC